MSNYVRASERLGRSHGLAGFAAYGGFSSMFHRGRAPTPADDQVKCEARGRVAEARVLPRDIDPTICSLVPITLPMTLVADTRGDTAKCTQQQVGVLPIPLLIVLITPSWRTERTGIHSVTRNLILESVAPPSDHSK